VAAAVDGVGVAAAAVGSVAKPVAYTLAGALVAASFGLSSVVALGASVGELVVVAPTAVALGLSLSPELLR